MAYHDAKTNSVAPKKAPTVQKLTPKQPNYPNKCLARRDTIPSAVALNSPKLAKIYFANIRLHDSLPTKKLHRLNAVQKQSAATLVGAGAAPEPRQFAPVRRLRLHPLKTYRSHLLLWVPLSAVAGDGWGNRRPGAVFATPVLAWCGVNPSVLRLLLLATGGWERARFGCFWVWMLQSRVFTKLNFLFIITLLQLSTQKSKIDRPRTIAHRMSG